jgi:PAS domain S-box-containing protein
MDSEIATDLRSQDRRFSLAKGSSVQSAAAAIGVAVVYLAGMKVGSALTSPGQPISTLWPPNALLMAALLVAPRRLWPLFLAIVLPAHILFQLQAGVPLATSLGWYVGNAGEALIGAALLRPTDRVRPLLRTVRGGIRFVLYGALIAPLVTSFWDAAVVVWTGLGSGYWNLFFIRLLSDTAAVLLFVPPIVTGFDGGVRRLLRSQTRRRIEVGALMATVLLIWVAVAAVPASPHVLILEVCAPLSCFLWAAWRFGPFESSVAILAVTLVEIWRSTLSRGPFGSGSPAENALSLQTYSATIAIPLLLFALSARERRLVNRKLRRNEEQLTLAMGLSRLASWDLDLASGKIHSFANWLGFRPVPLEKDLPPFLAVVHPEDRDEVARVHEDAVRRRSSYEVECRVYDERGGLHWILLKGQVMTARAGQAVRLLGVTQDITERKANQQALVDAERVAVLARNAARMVIWSVDLRTGEIYTDLALSSLLGFEPGQKRASLDFWLDQIYEPDRNMIASLKERVLGPSASVDDRGEIQIPELEYRMRHADGSLRWILARATIERNPDGSPRRIVGTAMDITKRKTAELDAEEQRRELTRMARVGALGELSAALAHEVSQPLTSILSNAQAARLLLGRESELAEIGRILDDIAAEDRRAGDVIRHLHTLLRKGPSRTQEVELNRVVEEILRLMRGDLIARNVTVRTHLQEGLRSVPADPVELQQVLLNLILNACDAMDGNASDDRILIVTTRQEPSRVVVAVSDVGSGIAPDKMDSLFKPFFTTKSHGIGMGLAICKSIVVGLGGRLWAENNPDRGSTFQFSIPEAETRSPA